MSLLKHSAGSTALLVLTAAATFQPTQQSKRWLLLLCKSFFTHKAKHARLSLRKPSVDERSQPHALSSTWCITT
jgi:hypothetical protein